MEDWPRDKFKRWSLFTHIHQEVNSLTNRNKGFSFFFFEKEGKKNNPRFQCHKQGFLWYMNTCWLDITWQEALAKHLALAIVSYDNNDVMISWQFFCLFKEKSIFRVRGGEEKDSKRNAVLLSLFCQAKNTAGKATVIKTLGKENNEEKTKHQVCWCNHQG